MSGKAVRDALWDYFRTNWTDTQILDSENLFGKSPPKDLTDWATLRFYPGFEEQRTIGPEGARCFREHGTVAAIVFVPSGTGSDVALQYAEDLRSLFRGVRIQDATSGQTIQLRAADPPNTALPSEVGSSEGNWYGFEVTMEYYTDIYNA